ncbi:trypsin-like serine peptidase [Nocardia spumae]|uniref:trypsin-like serine peptidase n=1 Tax=Nocardia spumae TaxID=2887190 RepID=UPI001D14DB5E|nr:hypothetical protein [Nocardia spumae]
MSTPQSNEPVSFDEAQEILGSKPGEETVPDPAEVVAPENMGRSVEDIDPSALEAVEEDGLEGYRPEGIPMVAYPDYAQYNAPATTEYTFGGKQWKVTDLHVFPPEDRRLLTDTSYPWRCAGLVTNSDGKSGSGVLVGQRVLLTARHLRPDVSISHGSWWMKFVPAGFDGAEPFGSSFVSDLRRPTPSGPHFDQMVGRLTRPLGQSNGCMGAQKWDNNWAALADFATIGYPGVFGGRRPFFQNSCAGFEFDSEKDAVLVATNADLTPGNSGGPFWTFIRVGAGLDPRVVAVVAKEATVDGALRNLCTSGDLLVRLVKSARTSWPL